VTVPDLRPSRVRFPSGEVELEGVLLAPPHDPTGCAAFAHPYPPYGGDMDNNVVAAASRAFAGAGVACLRFNFRGVGGSGGAFTDGRDEPADVLAALDFARRDTASARVWLGGYSFGAAMAVAAAKGRADLAGVVLVSPPVGMFGLTDFNGIGSPLLVLCGSDDPYSEVADVRRLLEGLPAATLRVVPGVDHFWHGSEDGLAREIAALVAVPPV
jgi:alpha/beta superfamily hydrolase